MNSIKELSLKSSQSLSRSKLTKALPNPDDQLYQSSEKPTQRKEQLDNKLNIRQHWSSQIKNAFSKKFSNGEAGYTIPSHDLIIAE